MGPNVFAGVHAVPVAIWLFRAASEYHFRSPLTIAVAVMGDIDSPWQYVLSLLVLGGEGALPLLMVHLFLKLYIHKHF
jgi:hypothetical protein